MRLKLSSPVDQFNCEAESLVSSLFITKMSQVLYKNYAKAAFYVGYLVLTKN